MNRRILLGAAAASLLLLAIWFVALWQPKGAELTRERDRLALADSEASQLETRLVKLRQAKANGPKLLAERDRLRSAVPDTPNLPQFILDANDAAVASGVEFISIAPGQPAPAATPGLPPEIDLNVQIEGGYFQVLDFVERLTGLQRVIVLDGINVTPTAAKGGAPDLGVSLTGRMFTTQLPASSAEAPLPGAAPATSTPESTPSTTVVPS